MLDVKHDPLLSNGTWKTWTARTQTIVIVACPDCGGLVSLVDHEILPDGSVKPSVGCPDILCKFHADVRLVGWPLPDQIKEA
jgi:hypothetical protein